MVLLMLLFVVAAVNVQDQPGTPDRQADIGGTVTAADTKLPLQNAEVRLVDGAGKQTRTVVTDAVGRYAFRSLPSGRYALSAWKLGYVRAGYKDSSPASDGKPLIVEDGEMSGVDFALERAAIIVAKVLDEFGEPVAGAWVNVLRASGSGADRKLVSASANGFIASTDDRGEVRLFNLAPGGYFVSAKRIAISSLSAVNKTSSDTFYPGTRSPAEAHVVQVSSGQEAFVTFSLDSTRLARIAGTIVSSAGVPDANSNLQLQAVSAVAVSGYAIQRSGEGRFVANGLPPGQYLIQVRPNAAAQHVEYANHEVQVLGEDVDGIVVVTSPPAAIHGRLTFDDDSQASRFRSDSLRIMPKFVGHTVARGQVSIAKDWTVEIRDIFGRGFFRVEDRTNTWFLEGVYNQGQDITDTAVEFKALDGKALEFKLTHRPAIVTGSASDSQGNTLSAFVAVAFPQDASRWSRESRYIVRTLSDQYGRFRLAGLPPGQYFVAALASLAEGDQFRTDVLESLRPAATKVSIMKGDSKEVRLKVAPLAR